MAFSPLMRELFTRQIQRPVPSLTSRLLSRPAGTLSVEGAANILGAAINGRPGVALRPTTLRKVVLEGEPMTAPAGRGKKVLVPKGAPIDGDTHPEAALARVRDVETHLLAVDPSKTHLPDIFKAVNELKKHYEFTISLPK